MTKIGIVGRQSSKHMLVSIVSTFFGVMNNLFIFPNFLGLYGILQACKNLAVLLQPISILGLRQVVTKFHQRITYNKGNIFLFGFAWLLISYCGFLSIFLIFRNSIVSFFEQYFARPELFSEYYFQILSLVFATAVLTFFMTLAAIKNSIVIPSILSNLILTKILFPTIIVLVSYFSFSDKIAVNFYIVSVFLVAALMLVYLKKKNWLDLSVTKLGILKSERKEVASFGMYSILDNAGAQLAFSIDIVMINILLGNIATGIYALFLFLSQVVKIPLTSIDAITNPIISKLWENKNLLEIEKLYKKSGSTIFVGSMLLFLMIQLGLDDLLHIINKENLASGKFIFLLIGGAMVINGMTSINSPILVFSNSYKWNLLFTIFLAVSNLILTYYFIVFVFEGEYKIVGAACSTAISLISFNIAKMIFIYAKFGFHPFSIETIKVIIISLITFAIGTFFDFSNNPMINLSLNSSLILTVYLYMSYILKVSPEVNTLINEKILKILK